MGYQIIEARTEGSSFKRRFIVYNEEIIVDLDSNFDKFKREIQTKGFTRARSEAPYISLDRGSITLIPKSLISDDRFMNESKKNSTHRYSGGKGAIDNPKESASGTEPFVRISAYEDDKRIDFENKKLKDGSFTTTLIDYIDCIKYNDDPIDRYALPNNEMIKWAFYIRPTQNDILQRGIVQTAFDHDGGGIEVYFENGTSNNTYIEKHIYGR